MANNNYLFIFLLNSCFDQSSMEGIIKALEKDGTEWALKQIEVTFIHILTVKTFHSGHLGDNGKWLFEKVKKEWS